ncbi:MAG: undecaprenyl-phosphate glucose phosphotransferase [Bradyrhizobiaceae bacterium]|nr:undecaprenyl-phosphate glucose phosphotransferase [Bradyrhizobiaceae bacterium]
MQQIGARELKRAVGAQTAAARTIPFPRERKAAAGLSPLAQAIASQRIAPAISQVVLSGVVRLAEFLAIAALGTAIYLLYVRTAGTHDWYYVAAIAAISLTAIAAFQRAELYDAPAMRKHFYQLSRIAAAWAIVFLIAFALGFFLRLEAIYSRVWAATWFASGLMMLFAGRIVLATLVRHWTRQGRLIRRTVIVGGGPAGEALVKSLAAQTDSDLEICGVFDDRADDRSPPSVAGVLKLGTVDHLIEFARRTRIDLLLVSLPITAEERVLQMVRKLWVLPVDIRLAAHISRLRFRPRAYSYIGNVPMLDVFDRPLADWDVVLKWLFDKIVGGLLLFAAAPVMAAVAVAIKLDSRGPVFFKQRRYGFNNELIEVFKFRSMYVETSDATAARLVTKDDPRVTRVGRFIRKTSLDELPQLINVVFKGNLSLVGPRPHATHAKAANRLYDEVVDGYFARHRVKPGITGWAQINGWRGETDTPEKIERRVEHDLYYIENWSLLFDLYILAKTPFALLKTESAY